ncbi:uncharacterized protein LOC100113692 [Nasonia vitripennis]|uniref:Uncharacterized protein n=1 Tax=Nasonia vitripennis TaxID=7425 RepID=A0A7M7Q9C5_NASVI|nr:uncharacterized protein LOC100113692 [Nasonia vitripennis]XP_031783837.1 uncharacterized protein LOC100113692 [Nasonia vitripennis]
MAARLKGWRYVAFLGTFAGSVCTFLYFTAVRPMIDPEPYKKIREQVLPKLPKSEW